MSDSLISTVLWEGGELRLMELAALWRTQSGYALRGSVVGTLDQAVAMTVRYDVGCTAAWETRSVHVEVESPPVLRRLRIEVAGDGTWVVDGAARPDLNGAVDVDIQVTPATNTLPIRRLGLRTGERADVTAAWIQLPALSISRLEQSYERIAQKRYLYRAGDFRAELLVDENGLIERYGELCRSVTRTPPSSAER